MGGQLATHSGLGAGDWPRADGAAFSSGGVLRGNGRSRGAHGRTVHGPRAPPRRRGRRAVRPRARQTPRAPLSSVLAALAGVPSSSRPSASPPDGRTWPVAGEASVLEIRRPYTTRPRNALGARPGEHARRPAGAGTTRPTSIERRDSARGGTGRPVPPRRRGGEYSATRAPPDGRLLECNSILSTRWGASLMAWPAVTSGRPSSPPPGREGRTGMRTPGPRTAMQLSPLPGPRPVPDLGRRAPPRRVQPAPARPVPGTDPSDEDRDPTSSSAGRAMPVTDAALMLAAPGPSGRDPEGLPGFPRRAGGSAAGAARRARRRRLLLSSS